MNLKKRLQNLSHVPELARSLWDLGPWHCFSDLLLRVITALIPVGTLWIAKLLIDYVIYVGRPGHLNLRVWILVAVECTMVLFGDIANRVVLYFDTVLSDRFTQWVGIRILDHASRLDLECFENPALQDCLERARNQARSNFAILQTLAQFLQQAIAVITLLAGTLLLAPVLVLLQVVCTIPIIAAETHFATRLYQLYRERSSLRREMDYLLQLATSATTVKETMACGLGGYFRRRYKWLSDIFNKEHADLSRARTAVATVLTSISTLSYYGAYLYMIFLVLTGQITVGSLVFLAGCFQRAKSQLRGLLLQSVRVTDHAMYLEDIFEFLKATPRVLSSPTAVTPPRPIRVGLEFRNVTFRYVNADRAAVRNVSFVIERGEKVALVGANGAGKTTIVKLVARLYDPTEGQILLDGIDLREYKLEEWRREISILFQDYLRYDMPARDNIGFGDVMALDDADRIRKATDEALAWPVISGLPKAFDQMLGRRFEGGIDLSGGQWQKLAIARACMRDAQVVILDEPAAALDARTEYEVLQQFSRLSRDRMAILISHRFSTARAADRIFVFNSGSLMELGTHGELMAKAGEYASLFNLQAATYSAGCSPEALYQ